MMTNTRRRTLAETTLTSMGARIFIITIAMSLLSYSHILGNLKQQTLEKLEKYITERAQKESATFELAEDNHTTLKQTFLELWPARKTANATSRFDQLFENLGDGTLRLIPAAYSGLERSHTSANDYKGESRWISGFIGKGTPDTSNEFRNRALLSYDLVDQFSQAWSNRFANTYISLPEGVNIVYWPHLNWAAGASSDLDIPSEEWVSIVSKENNPERKSVWTGLYYDQTADEWMVSCETPVDDESGQHLINIGHDILLNNVFQRVFDDHLDGAHNFIIRKDGRLIAHPFYVDEIREAKGVLAISELKGKPIASQYQSILSSLNNHGSKPQIINNEKLDAFIAIAPIQGPDWYFITVYPKSLLAAPSQKTAQFILILGLISLIIELFMLYLVLLRKVLNPMKQFEAASKLVSKGEYGLHSVLAGVNSRGDEVGRLGLAMLSMADRIEQQSHSMEATIKLRTQELEQAKEMAEQQARTDPLTGLANRRSFFELGVYALETAKREGLALTVIMIDLDRFKKINDQYGHAIGDRVLKAAAAVLMKSLRASDICARLGGEEFAILLCNTDLHGAVLVAEKIRILLSKITINTDDGQIKFTASFGVSQLANKSEQLNDLLKLADKRLYQAKNSGRDRVITQ